MSEIVRYEAQDSWAGMIGPIGDLANKIAGTEFVPRGFRGKPASVAAAILTGRELELGPLTALRGLQVIDGTVSMTAQMMAAKILAAGHRVEWVESTDKAAEVRITRGDGLGEAQARWTFADAQRAGLASKTNWQRYPRAMCRARALSECAGMIAPDVVLGLDVAADPDLPTSRPPGGGQVQTVQLAPADPEESVAPGEVQDAMELATNPPEPSQSPPDPQRSEPDVPMVTAQQLRKINAQLGDLERSRGEPLGRDGRRDLIRQVIGLDVLASAKDLTREQASTAVDRLDVLIEEAVEATSDVVDAEIVDTGTGEIGDGADG